MMRNVDMLLDDALMLPNDQRVRLVEQLVASLGDDFDPAVKEAWSQEIARRVREIDEGNVGIIVGDEVRRRIDLHLRGAGYPGDQPWRPDVVMRGVYVGGRIVTNPGPFPGGASRWIGNRVT